MNTYTHKLISNKLAKYEWVDKTGLRRPSLVVLDVTDQPYNPKHFEAEPLKIKKIMAISDYFNRGRFNYRKLPRIKGYKFLWYDRTMNRDSYALFLGYVKE